jgi:DNA-binding transcriptional LysR family regulator
MEMQQVRYFLALSETLNFTRAAENCHVTQPALTRAIRGLEAELGGELIRREGKLTHLTDLGRRMQPLLRQCHDSAMSAKAVARSLAKGEARSLAIGLSRTVDLRLFGDILTELFLAHPNLRLKLRRGAPAQTVEYLRNGEIEIAIAGSLDADWDRLEAWPIFTESFEILVGPGHRLAGRNMPDIPLEELLDETFLLQSDSETSAEETRQLEAAGIRLDRTHTVDSDGDLAALVEANVGVALAPKSALRGDGLSRHMTPNVDLRRTVSLYTVAGRPRSPEAATFISQVRSTDWGQRPN